MSDATFRTGTASEALDRVADDDHSKGTTATSGALDRGAFGAPRPRPGMNPDTPPQAATERWEELLGDADEIAREYADDGWETLVVHAGDVTPRTGDPYGLDVLAPGDEYEALEALVDDVTFDTSHVYRMEEGGVRFLIVAVEATDDEVAVVVPAYLETATDGELESTATEAGVMYTHVRPLSDDARVTFTHEDPDLFF